MEADALREAARTVSEDHGMGRAAFLEAGGSFEGSVLRMAPTGEKVEEQGWQRRPQALVQSHLVPHTSTQPTPFPLRVTSCMFWEWLLQIPGTSPPEDNLEEESQLQATAPAIACSWHSGQLCPL